MKLLTITSAQYTSASLTWSYLHYIDNETNPENSYDQVTRYWCLGVGYNLLQNGEPPVFGALEADTNGDDRVTLDELHAYSYDHIYPFWDHQTEVVCYPQNEPYIIFEKNWES